MNIKTGCPVIFRWGTFCRSVLTDGENKTVHTVLPAMKIIISVNPVHPEVPVPEMTPHISLPLGELALYAVFERSEGVEGEINVSLTPDFNLPLLEPKDIFLTLSPEHTHYQLALRFDQINISVPTNTDEQVLCLACSFKYNNDEIGKVSLPIKVIIQKGEYR